MRITKHADKRFAQRGIKVQDLELCMAIGEFIGDEEIFVSNKAADDAIRKCKKVMNAIERLRNKKFVVAEDHWVTGYCPRKGNLRKMIRDGREQGLRL